MDYTDVIIIKGPVETLSFFSERLAETFYRKHKGKGCTYNF